MFRRDVLCRERNTELTDLGGGAGEFEHAAQFTI
jgi:hypothetical protein